MAGGTVCFQGNGYDDGDGGEDFGGKGYRPYCIQGNLKLRFLTKISEQSHLIYFSVWLIGIYSFRSEPVCIFFGTFEE